MTNLIIASFKQEAEAIEASQKIKELELIGDITIYEMTIIKKNADGEAVALEADTTDGLGTLSGMAIGTLIGVLGGPVGVAIGMLTGTLAGAVLDEDQYGFSEEFRSRAINQLQPGTVAIIAEMDEDNEIFVDSTLAPLGGSITRTDVDYEYEEQSDEEMEELEEEIADERAKIKSATVAERASIRQKINELKEKRKNRITGLKEKVKETASGFKTSVKELKVSRLRNSIEKHQRKIAALENKLQTVLGKEQKEVEHL